VSGNSGRGRTAPLPLRVTRPVGRLVRALGVHVEEVLPAPARRIRIVARAPQPPLERLRKGVPGNRRRNRSFLSGPRSAAHLHQLLQALRIPAARRLALVASLYLSIALRMSASAQRGSFSRSRRTLNRASGTARPEARITPIAFLDSPAFQSHANSEALTIIHPELLSRVGGAVFSIREAINSRSTLFVTSTPYTACQPGVRYERRQLYE